MTLKKEKNTTDWCKLSDLEFQIYLKQKNDNNNNFKVYTRFISMFKLFYIFCMKVFSKYVARKSLVDYKKNREEIFKFVCSP